MKLSKRYNIGQLNNLGITMSAKVNFAICSDSENQYVEKAFSVPCQYFSSCAHLYEDLPTRGSQKQVKHQPAPINVNFIHN